MAFSGSYIGEAIAISASVPSTTNQAGFQALSYTNIIGCVMWDGTGDSSDDITVEGLDGRKVHLNGLLDGGAVKFKFRTDAADAGQILLKSLNNQSTQASIRLTEPDGKLEYAFGLISNIKALPRDSKSWKGFEGEFRVNSIVVTV